MNEPSSDYEGTWDELAAHSAEFAGRRLRLIVLPESSGLPSVPEAAGSIEEKIAEIASRVPPEEWDKVPPELTDRLDHYIYGTPKP